MRTGRILRRFKAKNGREVTLRTPRWEDLDDFLDHINSLVDEGAEIARNVKATREEEADWLGAKLANIEKGGELLIVAEVGGRVVATSGLTRRRAYESHVGVIGIAVGKDCRNIGIGREMLETVIHEAEKMGIKILFLRLFSTNKAAYNLYKKMGFKETGRTPRIFYKDGRYMDEVTMTKEI